MDALELLYEELSKKQEETEEKLQAVAADTAGAAELVVKGDEDKVMQIENRIQRLEVDMQKSAADSAAGAMDVVDG